MNESSLVAGVPTELRVVSETFHGFDVIAPDTRVSTWFIPVKLDALRRAFGIKQ